jgi:uncharacterized protein
MASVAGTRQPSAPGARSARGGHSSGGVAAHQAPHDRAPARGGPRPAPWGVARRRAAVAMTQIGDNRRGTSFADAMNPQSFAPIVQNPVLVCAVLLTVSNLFMTFAWYGHLKHLQASPWWTAALVSWGIALFEYLLQVPANRIGFTVLSLAQLKIMQEVITLAVFVPFAVLYMDQPVKLDYLWAGLCLMGAVYFIFRG